MEEEIAIAVRCRDRFFLNLNGGESPAIVRVYLDSSFRARDIKRALKMNLKEDRGVDTPRSPNKIPKRNLPPEKSELPSHYTGEIKSTDPKCRRFQTRDLVTFFRGAEPGGSAWSRRSRRTTLAEPCCLRQRNTILEKDGDGLSDFRVFDAVPKRGFDPPRALELAQILFG